MRSTRPRPRRILPALSMRWSSARWHCPMASMPKACRCHCRSSAAPTTRRRLCVSAGPISRRPTGINAGRPVSSDSSQRGGQTNMSVVGRVESVWRYPVKSMRGEQLPEIFAGFAGVYGDRLLAFKSTATPAGFPYLTGREAHEMLLYRPRFRHPEKAAKPANLAAAQELSPILNFVSADPVDLAVDVETPAGEVLAIDDPLLARQLAERAGDGHSLTLLRSERAMTDCRPISLFSLQTARQLGEEVGAV